MIDDAVLQSVARALLHFTWQGAAVGFVLWGGVRLGLARSSRGQYALGVGALILVGLAPVATFAWIYSTTPGSSPTDATTIEAMASRDPGELAEPLSNAPTTRTDSVAPSTDTRSGRPTHSTSDPGRDHTPTDTLATGSTGPRPSPSHEATDAHRQGATVTSAELPVHISSAHTDSVAFRDFAVRFGLDRAHPWIVGAWLLGVLFFALRWIAGYRTVTQLYRDVRTVPAPWNDRIADWIRHSGLEHRITSHLCPGIQSPAIVGWLRPRLLMPMSLLTGLSPSQVEAIVVHELAHVRRLDPWVNLCQSWLEALLFFHPSVWWISGFVRTQREYCCDDEAVRHCNDATLLAEALTRLERLRTPSPSLALAADGASLMTRIERLLCPNSPRQLARPHGVLLTLVAILFVLAASALSSATPGENQTSSASTPRSDSIPEFTFQDSLPPGVTPPDSRPSGSLPSNPPGRLPSRPDEPSADVRPGLTPSKLPESNPVDRADISSRGAQTVHPQVEWTLSDSTADEKHRWNTQGWRRPPSKPNQQLTRVLSVVTDENGGFIILQLEPDSRNMVHTAVEVLAGDTLVGIAREQGVSVAQLRSWNPQLKPSQLSVGDVIKVPMAPSAHGFPRGVAELWNEKNCVARIQILSTSGNLVSAQIQQKFAHLGVGDSLRLNSPMPPTLPRNAIPSLNSQPELEPRSSSNRSVTFAKVGSVSSVSGSLMSFPIGESSALSPGTEVLAIRGETFVARGIIHAIDLQANLAVATISFMSSQPRVGDDVVFFQTLETLPEGRTKPYVVRVRHEDRTLIYRSPHPVTMGQELLLASEDTLIAQLKVIAVRGHESTVQVKWIAANRTLSGGEKILPAEKKGRR